MGEAVPDAASDTGAGAVQRVVTYRVRAWLYSPGMSKRRPGRKQVAREATLSLAEAAAQLGVEVPILLEAIEESIRQAIETDQVSDQVSDQVRQLLQVLPAGVALRSDELKTPSFDWAAE